MAELDTVILSRIQFAFVIAFHILFPTLTIGLSVFLTVLEALWLRTRDEFYFRLARFWAKIFGLAFGMGVVTGVVLEFQFGTNFSGLSRIAGDILGPLLTYEVLSAFFLEAGFLGVMLFGWRRVGPRLHFFATCMVALGTVLSAFWILAANSWMQTPDGYATAADGRLLAEDWWAIIFNPSLPYRFAHMTMASLVTTAFVVVGVSAWHLLRDKHVAFAQRSLSLAIPIAAVLALTQIVLGDLHGLNTEQQQPVKVAAMEGHWETRKGAPLILFAWPDQRAERNLFEIAIPYAGSLILKHELDGEVTGLKSVPQQDRPNVPIVFYSFRLMVGIGFLLATVGLVGSWLRWRRRLREARWFHWLSVIAGPLAFVAVLAGWVVTEAGRQPWVVYGLVRTVESASALPLGNVATSLVLYVVVYNLLLAAYLFFLYKLVEKGPNYEEALPHVELGRPALRMATRTPWQQTPGEYGNG